MSEYSEDGYDDEETEAAGPKALRDAHNKAKAEAKRLTKELADLQEKFGEISKANRAASLADNLTAAGVKDAVKVAKLYPSDAEATPEAITEWLKDYGDVLNIQSKTEPAETQEQSSTTTQPGAVDPAVAAYLASQQKTRELEQNKADAPTNDEAIQGALDAIYKNAKSPEDLSEGLRQLGVKVTGGYRPN